MMIMTRIAPVLECGVDDDDDENHGDGNDDENHGDGNDIDDYGDGNDDEEEEDCTSAGRCSWVLWLSREAV